MDYVFAPQLQVQDTEVPLTTALTQHLKALRVRNDEYVGVINGKGLVARARVVQEQKTISLAINAVRQELAPPIKVLVLGVLDHRDRFEFAIEKAAELGVTDIIPLMSDHVQYSRSSLERLESKCIAACTQSGNPWLPIVHKELSLHEVLLWQTSMYPKAVCVVGDAEGKQANVADLKNETVVIIGPEGGFSKAEQAMITAHPNVVRWSVGNHRLRAETAAVALVSILTALQ